jgi:hypothetical protein
VEVKTTSAFNEKFEKTGYQLHFSSDEVSKFVSSAPVLTSKQQSSVNKAIQQNKKPPSNALASTKCSKKYPYYLDKDVLNKAITDKLISLKDLPCPLKITGNIFSELLTTIFAST